MRRYKPSELLIYMVNFVFGLAAFGLLLRFLFRLFGANPEAPIVSFLYNSTATLLNPFRGIFDTYTLDSRYVFEFSTLLAIGAYLFIAWIIIEFIEYIDYSTTREV